MRNSSIEFEVESCLDYLASVYSRVCCGRCWKFLHVCTEFED